jgi:hypothetical protein
MIRTLVLTNPDGSLIVKDPLDLLGCRCIPHSRDGRWLQLGHPGSCLRELLLEILLELGLQESVVQG